MSIGENRGLIMGAFIVGLCLFIGLAAGGYFIGKGGTRFKSETRTVTVKGLVEREVKSDKVVWVLNFRRAGDNLREAHAQISADREATISFLKIKGFRDEEIVRQPTRTIDKFAREYGQANEKFRYFANSSLVVTTNNVDLVTKTLGATEELLQSGVVLDGQQDGGMANPRYIVSSFNDLRPQLLADATKNARATAQQFAADAGTRVGRIRSANQGMIQIFGSDGNNESAPYSPTST
ncbi:MAG: SIMPL domain-containing protein, partial [Syntrophaceae bacterium]|nr:SIMPL domain-containing protein [Syntrophaceae bacterium]